MANYSVKQVSLLAKVTVRTLHLYDELGLLKPLARSPAGYRSYGEAELLRLQQILFYREMDIPLQQIAGILDTPGFDLLKALGDHKASLKAKRKQLLTMLETINKTIDHLKNKTMLSYEELYEGFSKEDAEALRNETLAKWPKEAAYAENGLLKKGKESFMALQQEQNDITNALAGLMNEAPENPAVQFEIARHYQNIRSFWGTENNANPQAKQYAGLGQLYVDDKRYTRINGKANEQFGVFMCKAMKYYADTKLK